MADEQWVPAAEAADTAGISLGTVRRWYQSGDLPSRLEDGKRHVPLDEVMARATKATPRPAPSSEPTSTDLVVQTALANMHDLANQLAEARERAGALDATVKHLQERLDEVRKRTTQLEDLQAQLHELRARTEAAPSTDGDPLRGSRRRWWQRASSR